MKFLKKTSVLFVLACGAVAIVYAARANYFQRFTVGNAQKYLLEQDGTVTQTGALKFGNNEDSSMTLPTTSTADDFGVKVPFYNASGAATARGTIIISSITTSNVGYGSVQAVLSTTTWVGIADGVYANGAKGWMTVGGYAAVLTTGAVAVGDLIVTTNSVAGYGGAIAGADSVVEGTVVGKALSVGTAAGGLTLIRVGN